MYFVPMSNEQKEYVRNSLRVTTPNGCGYIDRVKDLISTVVKNKEFKISIVPTRSNGFHGIDCAYMDSQFGTVTISSRTNHFGDETTCSLTLRSIKEGESHSFMEYDIMDLELQVILAENFSFGEASKPSMTEDEGDSKLNTNILKGDTRLLYNRVKEGAKKLGTMTKKGGSKITEKTRNFVGDATYIKETNSLINDAWNLLMRIATSAALSVLLGPVIGLFIFICLQAKKVQFNSQLTVKKIEDTIQNKLDELEDKLAEAEENKNHDLANRYRRIITKTKAKLETVQKKISEETDGAATSFEINRREKG
jgi:hypothetical protein